MVNSRIKRDIQRKIKTREELRAVIGPFPRQKSVALSVGIFDIVHPGHLRHLLYVKERAEILIACITSDRFVSQKEQKSFIPQDLRALNLAALEFVDYVLIDDNPSPIEAIKFLQPDLFAKGYEAFSGGGEQQNEERDAVMEYGGEILLTPGDVTNLPSRFSNATEPQLSTAKLLVLMQAEGVTFDMLREAVSTADSLSIHVVGDVVMDLATATAPTGGVTKSPTVSVVIQRETSRIGAAGMVALHFVAAGCKVSVSTVLGEDKEKDLILSTLEKEKVHCAPVIDTTRPTPVTTTFIAQGHRLLRTNSFDNRIISEKVALKLSHSILQSSADCYVFCDYRFGIFARNTISSLVGAVPKGACKVADSHVASRWGNILDFQGFDLITPNEREARFALGDQDSTVRPLALEVFQRANCKLLLLKLGDRGVFVYRAASPGPKSFFTVDSFAEKVVDAAGAGDAFLAYATIGMLKGRSGVVAAILGIFASAVACERGDHEPVTAADVLSKIKTIESLARSTHALVSST